MARAMRDITYPDRLKLYDHAAARTELERTVPWFVTLLTTVRSDDFRSSSLSLSLSVESPVLHHELIPPPMLLPTTRACRSKTGTNSPARARSLRRTRRLLPMQSILT
jgi:hypothetical protein